MVAGLLFCATQLLPQQPADPPRALALGIVLALAGLTAWPKEAKKWSRLAIQAGIVLLGFWISMEQVMRAGVAGLAFSTGAIVIAVGVSAAVGRMLRTPSEVGTLLSAGTAICGGSAIAATGAVINASAGAIGVTTAIVFILNACGVYAYPPIGHALGLSDRQFGAWCAVGVHDVAGVVAAAKSFSERALADATVIKLTRVLWIVPVALVLGRAHRRNTAGEHAGHTNAPFPWFILLFALACGLRAGLDRVMDPATVAAAGDTAKRGAVLLMTVALFLIGTGLSREVVMRVGWKALLHGVLLWLAVSGASLAAAKLLLT